MNKFIITVDFKLKPGSMSAFRTLIDTNAKASCRDEPGCRRFDVAVPRGSEDRIFLYEIYDTRDAFEAHKRTPHFHAFNTASAPLVESKSAVELDLVCEGGEG
ncbi:MAG: antibiotic biosynthesis monooxygenase [Proteobacteria bacterium]|nr:antibiotic biosynthesis monooxygenase [Pseudomonadota bacterium]